MKRLLIMFLAAGVSLGGISTAEATKPSRTERTLHGSYGPYPAPVTACNDVLGSWACMIVRARPTERFVDVELTDTHGLPVYFSLFDPRTGFHAEFCGETGMPIALGRARYLEIEVGVSRWAVQTACPASSVKSTGKIRVTLSNSR